MFETLTNPNRTRVLFGSVRCGAEPEQTEHDLENVLFGLFVRLAISALIRLLAQLMRNKSEDGIADMTSCAGESDYIQYIMSIERDGVAAYVLKESKLHTMPSKATESEQAPSKTASTAAMISIGRQSAIASTTRARTAERETNG